MSEDDSPVAEASCCGRFSRSGSIPASRRESRDVAFGGRPRPDRFAIVPGGTVRIGTASPLIAADGEGPPRRVQVRSFAIDPYAVTNAAFAEFVAQTGHVTDAERHGWSFVFQGLLDAGRRSLVVEGANWWVRIEGASWSAPEGPGSGVEGRENHPVTHVSFADAQVFARWAGGRLPTEAEWEHAARGGLPDPRYPWGDREPDDHDFVPCNIFQGRFPDCNTGADGYLATAPVDAFEPNGYGLHNMAGNVWEWCLDPFRLRSLRKEAKARETMARAEGQHVLKGGSYLCHASYCWRYRIAARTASSADSSTGHMGFRIVFDL